MPDGISGHRTGGAHRDDPAGRLAVQIVRAQFGGQVLDVHIGARISAVAQPGEVLVSRTVKDLVAGSGIEFYDRGDHELKGVPGGWQLYGVRQN